MCPSAPRVSDTSILDPKGSKQHKSLTDSDSSFYLSASELTLPLQVSVCASSTLICKYVAPIVKPAMTGPDQIDMISLEQMQEKLLVRPLKEQKVEILQETNVKVSADVNEMRGEIHDLKVENDELKKRAAELEATSVSEKDAKIHAVNNDQYARRSSMVVYGITLKDKQDPGDAAIETIKTHLKITLQRSVIEICHPLGQDSKNKNRLLVVKFRFRDVKWDIIHNEKAKDVEGHRDLICWLRECRFCLGMEWQNYGKTNRETITSFLTAVNGNIYSLRVTMSPKVTIHLLWMSTSLKTLNRKVVFAMMIC